MAAVTRSFNRWNVLACGFALPGNLNVQVDRDTATVDFLDVGTDGEGDDSNVFITLVKEDGGWKGLPVAGHRSRRHRLTFPSVSRVRPSSRVLCR